MDPRAVLLASFLTGATVASPAAVAMGGTGAGFDVAGAYSAASAAASCHPDPRDIAAIQSVESPSAVVLPDGLAQNPDGSPIRGDGGRSYGPFQFYEVAGTWSTYGAGGNPDMLADSAAATARMLCADNYATDRHAAIAAHNGSGPAAQAYADRVIAAADRLAPITAAPSNGSASSDGCEETGRRGLGDVLNRAWCKLVVSPWETLGKKKPSPAWSTVDHAVFGDGPVAPPGVSTGPASTKALPGSDGLNPAFASKLATMAAAAPGSVTITSGFRTVQDQLDLGGGEPDCGVMVACVRNGICGSMHCQGLAADLSFDSDSTKAWVHAHAADYGLTFPMDYEDWHIEPVGARGAPT